MGPKVLSTEQIEKKESQAKRRLVPVPTAAYAEEVERWRRKAAADSRPLSSWIRLRVLRTEEHEDEAAARLSERQDG